MTDWKIKLPVRDPGETISARTASELPQHLDGENADVARGTLLFFLEAALPGVCTVGQAVEVIASFEPHERKQLLRAVRRRVGLRDPDEIDAELRRESASRAARIQQAKTYGQPLRLGYTESGAIVDLDEIEADAARERARAASVAVQRGAEQVERAVEAERLQEHREAEAARVRSELPWGCRDDPGGDRPPRSRPRRDGDIGGCPDQVRRMHGYDQLARRCCLSTDAGAAPRSHPADASETRLLRAHPAPRDQRSIEVGSTFRAPG